MITLPSTDKYNYARYRLSRWLWICTGLLFIMIVIGGVTRLTGSGLSIVDWQPIRGALPPLTAQAWHDLFAAYQQTPEYQKINYGMSLGEFKDIFWLEFLHRFWGRLIGLAFLVPMTIAWWNTQLRKEWFKKLLIIWLLGAAQGGIGWYMVKSGLVNDPHISQYRLTLHLLLGCTTYGLTLWCALNARSHIHQQHPTYYSKLLYSLLCISFLLTFLYGGLVAGLKAGLIYNTFPTMAGEWIPAEWLNLQPLWRNFFENHATVQWCHRVLAVITVSLATLFYYKHRIQPFSSLLIGVVLAQAFLGITTLLLNVPVILGAFHQAGALIVLSTLILIGNYCGRPQKSSKI